jgi:nicotinamide mononucleotide transporter
MEKIKSFLKSELWVGYTIFEKLFLVSMLLAQVIVYIIAPDTVLGIISGISGVISVVLCAKGKISFYFVGFVQTISYIYLAFTNAFYGEVIENIFYLVTMVWGIFIWKKNMQKNDNGTSDVKAKKFTPIKWVLSVIGTVIATALVGMWLDSIGNNQAYLDAATNVMAIFAQFLMIWCYREQWLWWIIINVICIVMWFNAGNWSMVAMYIAWTVNAAYGWYNWSKLNKEQTESIEKEITNERLRAFKEK